VQKTACWLCCHKKYGGIFGWHGGILEEQSPFTFSDFIKQRQRWIKGNVENLSRLGLWEKVKALYRMVSWFLGAVSSLALIPSFFVKQSYPLFLAPLFVLDTIILFGSTNRVEMNF
jgi:cellulose synthase/poly-beta-1,6-N-acetylglucosamine synthase-like glycosyltransferase